MEIAINPLEIGFMHRAAQRINYKPRTKFIPLAEVRDVKVTDTFVVREYRAMKEKRKRFIIVNMQSMVLDNPKYSHVRNVKPGVSTTVRSAEFEQVSRKRSDYVKSIRNCIPHAVVNHQKYFQ